MVVSSGVEADVAFSPKGDRIAFRHVAFVAPVLKVFDPAESSIWSLDGGSPGRFAWSPAGDALAALGTSGPTCTSVCAGAATVWTREGGAFGPGRSLSDYARSAAFTPDGAAVVLLGTAAGSADLTAVVTATR